MDRDALRRTLTLASAFKEGDRAVGGGDDERVRRDARRDLAAVTLGEIHRTTLVDDGVSDALERTLDAQSQAEIAGLTVGGLKQILLGSTGPDWLGRHRGGADLAG